MKSRVSQVSMAHLVPLLLLMMLMVRPSWERLSFAEDDLMQFLPGIDDASSQKAHVFTTTSSSSEESEGELLSLDEEGAPRLPRGWENCGDEDDLFRLHSLSLTPDPPRRASMLKVNVAGELLEPLMTGRVNYTVRFGIIPIVKDSVELCEALRMEPKIPQCPLRSGLWNVTHEVELPAETPFGKYSIEAAAWNRLGKRIFCLRGSTTVGLFKGSRKDSRR